MRWKGLNCCPLNSFPFFFFYFLPCWPNSYKVLRSTWERQKGYRASQKQLELKFPCLWICKHLAAIAKLWPSLLPCKLESSTETVVPFSPLVRGSWYYEGILELLHIFVTLKQPSLGPNKTFIITWDVGEGSFHSSSHRHI